MQNQQVALWAVDPFTEDKAFQIKVVKALDKLTRKMGCVIEPVCVLSPDQLRVPVTAFKSPEKGYQLEAEKILKGWVKALKIPGMLPPRLLVQEEYSVRSSVATLLDYATQARAVVLGLGTHNKKPLHRFFVGSFAETLVLHSKVPVLLVSPRLKGNLDPKRVLFPTDFSAASENVFGALLPRAKQFGSKLVLFHQAQFEVPPPIYGFDPGPVYQTYLDQDLTAKREKAAQWVRRADAAGVKVEVAISEKPGFPAAAIFRAITRHKCGLVAMASVSGSAAAVFLGSISRQVMRQSPVPVWILHGK